MLRAEKKRNYSWVMSKSNGCYWFSLTTATYSAGLFEGSMQTSGDFILGYNSLFIY